MQCRVCGGSDFSLVLDLGEQPWGNHFLKKEEVGTEPSYPLRLIYCHNCSTSQLDYTVKKEVMFSDHTYLSGITKSLSNHFDELAQEVDRAFFSQKSQKKALDIGSNDGTQLKYYKKLGYNVLGVESSERVAQIANENKIRTLRAFFNLDVAKTIDDKFDVINASGVFYHVEELHSITDAIRFSLNPEGVFVVQFMYMKCIQDNTSFDQIYHEHLLFYTLQNIEHLLNLHGLALFDAYLSPIHGGSIMGFVGHKGKRAPTERLQRMRKEEKESRCNEMDRYLEFSRNVQELKEENLVYLQQKKSEGKTIFGMGAPVKGNTLLNYFDIGTDMLDCLAEKNTLREGLYSPGKHIPIKMEDRLERVPDIYYVLAWNFKNEILKNNQHLIDQGVEFYFPINTKKVLSS